MRTVSITTEELRLFKRLARKAQVKLNELPKPIRPVKLGRAEIANIKEMLARHNVIVVAKLNLNGHRKRGARVYEVESYLALKQTMRERRKAYFARTKA